MIRLVAVALGAALLALVLLKIFRELRSANVDWTGVTFALGFVAMAFYLRFVTGIG